MAPPRSNGENPFIIPSLMPPRTTETGTNRSFSSSLSSQHQDGQLSRANIKSLMSSSPNVGNNISQPLRLRRTLHAKEAKRKAFSPIENFSSASNKNSSTKKNGNTSFSKSPSFASPLPSISGISSSTGKHNRSGQKIALLFGETMESLFRLSKQYSDEEQYKLHKNIVDGSCTDDPGRWCRVLELARTQHQHIKNFEDDHNRSVKENLVRLHRLATLRFSLNNKEFRTSSSSRSHQKLIFEIWLSYAKIHAKVGNLDEARRIFGCIEENESVLLNFSSSSPIDEEERGNASLFYLAYADFELNHGHDKSRARKILLRGIKEKAEPILELEKALTVLTCSDDGYDEITRRYRITGTPVSEKKPDAALGSRRFESPSLTKGNNGASRMKRELIGNDVPSNSPKRLKPSNKVDHEVLTDRRKNEVGNSSDGRKKVTIEVSTKIPNNGKQSIKGLKIFKETPTVPTATISRSRSQGKPPVKKNRPTLTSRLARKGLSGKAKRVDCSYTVDDDDSSSDDETQHDNAKSNQKTEDLSSFNDPIASSISSKSKSGKSSKVPSFKKVDLSYMWAWDPNKKGNDQNETATQNHCTEKSSDGTSSTGSGQSTFNTQHTAIDTQGSGSSVGDSSSGKNITSSSTTKEGGQAGRQYPQSTTLARTQTCVRKEDQNTVGVTKNKNVHGGRNKVDGENGNSMTQADESTISKRQALVAKANLEFLPLVHEDNILRVNTSTYAKLGVIGKGGSCKVYRALSKKCAVVAIKKVKLAGMDRKAIEGYANEISLLKRLRGNPAIIQMYDSEVDIQRKSIFLVMEVGETDLNNVLQQRALSKTSRSLNMNFIRLTWQQMLSAVHCIHEERIIHSDLKPANFLFVRGALKLIDFGIAKAIMNDDTTNIYRENHIGTLNYMSPEAILDTGSGQDGPRMKIGRASDVWSLGCILYEMVYGKTPFYKLHFIQKLQAIVNPGHNIQFPEDEDAEAAIDAMKLCLCRNPEERPPIIGKDGLLNEHWFLHAKRRPR